MLNVQILRPFKNSYEGEALLVLRVQIAILIERQLRQALLNDPHRFKEVHLRPLQQIFFKKVQLMHPFE